MLKKYLLLLLMSFITGVAFAQGSAEPDVVSYPLILEYHQICLEPQNELDVSLENFQKELDWLQDHGYHALSMPRFLYCINKHLPFPTKSVLITFDDGYQGVYDYALPELRKRYMHATLFVVTDSLDKKDKPYDRLTTKEVEKMGRDYLVDIGSHTLSHDWLTKLDAKTQQAELQESRKVLEKLTGKPCLSLAYPYGDFNSQVIENVRKAGYQTALASYDENIAAHLNRYSLPRIFAGRYVEKNNMKVFKATFN